MEQGHDPDRGFDVGATCGSERHLPASSSRTRTFSLIVLIMYIPPTSDLRIPVKRLQRDVTTGTLVEAPRKELFLRGPIPLEWLGEAAKLPGKTINVAIALWWLYGMAKGKPFKPTRLALKIFCVERDAASAGLTRLEQAGLIQVERKPGQRPIVSILNATRR